MSISKEIPDSTKKKIYELFEEFHDVYSQSDEDLGITTVADHEKKLTDETPFKVKQYSITYAKRKAADDMITKMIQLNILQPSSSPYASPVFLVSKQYGSDRFCIDFKKLNSGTVKDNYSMSSVSEKLDMLDGSTIFTTLDLASGHCQIGLSPEAKEKTAIVTKFGPMEFNVMPFGLCNAWLREDLRRSKQINSD